jgi:hypothetical protein
LIDLEAADFRDLIEQHLLRWQDLLGNKTALLARDFKLDMAEHFCCRRTALRYPCL